MEKEQPQDRCQRFIDHTIDRIQKDRAMRARLRRADNPDMEYQSWEYFVRFGVDLQNRRECKAFATVAAALAREEPKADGNLSIGSAIALSYRDGNNNDQAKTRLRRLLACKTSEDACNVLRQLLRLVASKGQSVKFKKLLKDLLYFSERTKEQWAQDFFRSPSAESAEEE